jgi:Tfp pilus assembly protein PilE
MGQQQLLLIVLGVIIVGIAVVVGINVFTASSMNSNRDAVIADLTTLAAMAQQHYRKPAAMGGGQNAFDASNGGTAWSVPASLVRTANMSADVAATVGAQTVTLVGSGTETGTDGSAVVQVTMVVGKNSITSTTIDN